MTSELKCPFCQTELEQMHDKKMLGCPKCLHIADGAFWVKAIQAKQDLEIATKALEEIDTTRCIPQQTLISLGKFSKTTRFNAGNIICVATPDYIHNLLCQINRKQD